ncbi:snapalysin family zinc-dependent metalloprotease [Planomonospora sp. ID82291]|uniref:snapalysin family zinc-dependent metalloprotease n=1 Tax=Planomonospora sp. ID82291 TaxID=2738136 RepID=UPI0018C3C0BE|nr:snapalysin family zinc-dependent metalloprotease [Planomonospora sp. ID82291]MBG0816720.1 snapalysin family zinc-dependent metalloprotease [Planomonospora sp. ID82291]
MSRIPRSALVFALGLAFVTTATPAQAVPAPAAPAVRAAQGAQAAVRVVRYDASRAAEFRSAVDQAAQIWNGSVSNVRLVAGSPADFVVLADNGWPRAQPVGLGRGTVWMGRQATGQGYDPLRIATHEIGHILGLPDRRTGRCTDLMSGSSAGTGCTNPYPSTAERAAVDRNFAGLTPPAVEFGEIYVDVPVGAAP